MGKRERASARTGSTVECKPLIINQKARQSTTGLGT